MVFRSDAVEYAMIPVFLAVLSFSICMCCCRAVCPSSVSLCSNVCFWPVSDRMQSLFACLPSPLDGMGRVSQGKTKPTKNSATNLKNTEFLLTCNSPLLTFIPPLSLFLLQHRYFKPCQRFKEILLVLSPIGAT